MIRKGQFIRAKQLLFHTWPSRLDPETLSLSPPDTAEKLQWGENLCFKVRGKIFAIVDLSQGKLTPITLKSAPEQFHELLEIEGISQAPYVGRYKWIFLEHSNVVPSHELEDLIRQSYELVAAKAPKKKATRKKALRKRSKKVLSLNHREHRGTQGPPF